MTADAARATTLLTAAEAPLRGVPEPRALWDELAGVGLPALLVPRTSGGLGLGLGAAVPVAARLAGQARTLPFVVSAVLATRLLEAVGATSLLTELATGDRVLGVELAPGVVADRGCRLDHDVCGSVLLLGEAGDAVGVQLADEPDRLSRTPIGLLPQSAVRRALDDASVVAAAELLAAVGVTAATRHVEDLVASAARAADEDAPGRGEAAARARVAVAELAPPHLVAWREPWPALLHAGWI